LSWAPGRAKNCEMKKTYTRPGKIPVGLVLSVLLFGFGAVSGCSSAPSVKQQAYAKLNNEHTFEYEFPEVWKAIEASFHNFKVADRDPSQVGPLEMKKLTKRKLETDWILGQSRDKYIEYKVNGSPRKQYLQTRLKYTVLADRVIGGTHVAVKTAEEVERLNKDGTSSGWDSSGHVDPSRAAEVLDKIGQSLTSAVP
jgi:hypothetical protein